MSKFVATSSVNAAYAAAHGVLYSGARADAVTAALVVIATDYASNGGSKPRIEQLAADCRTTASGAPRKMTPHAPHTTMLEWVEWVMQSAPHAGARPQNGDIEARDAALSVYSIDASARWEALRDEGERERKQARDKLAKARAKAVASASDAAAESTADVQSVISDKVLAPVAQVDTVAAALAALTPEQLADLVSAHGAAVARLVNIAQSMATASAVVASAKAPKAPAVAPTTEKEATA